MSTSTASNSVDLRAVVDSIPALSCAGSDVELVDLIRGLEVLKNACSGAQAHASVALLQLREDEARALGRPVERVAAGVAAEVGLARRESPNRASRLLGLATVLTRELPCTIQALSAGQISEWRASLMARETACISRADRGLVDAELGPRLELLSDREIVAEAREAAYRLDPHSVVDRIARAEADRRVTIRPAPDCMAQVTALLPVAQGVAVYAALAKEADTQRAAGDTRTRGQVMADTLVTRATGQTSAEALTVSVGLVMTDEALLGDSHIPSRLEGYGPVPAGVARRLVSASSRTWVRRLYARPDDGRLVAMDTRQRLFPDTMKRFIVTRDELCRTPWCGAPIRHADHVLPVHAGGMTTLDNSQGLCERCNHVKERYRWRVRPGPDSMVATTTPTGHEYRTSPRALPHEPLRPLVLVDLNHAA